MNTLFGIAVALFYIGSCGYAIWKGGPFQKGMGTACLLAWLVSYLKADILHLAHNKELNLIIDMSLFGAAVGLAYGHRVIGDIWSLAIIVMLGMDVGVQLVPFLGLKVPFITHVVTYVLASFGVQILLVVETAVHARDRNSASFRFTVADGVRF